MPEKATDGTYVYSTKQTVSKGGYDKGTLTFTTQQDGSAMLIYHLDATDQGVASTSLVSSSPSSAYRKRVGIV